MSAASKAAFQATNRQLDNMNARFLAIENRFDGLEGNVQLILNSLQGIQAAAAVVAAAGAAAAGAPIAGAPAAAAAVAAAPAQPVQEGKFFLFVVLRF
jgi:hypothetical protein